jgi:hypothetical protein
MATNLQISPYGLSRFEVQGDVLGDDGFRRTIKLAVFDTLAEARAFVAQRQGAAS